MPTKNFADLIRELSSGTPTYVGPTQTPAPPAEPVLWPYHLRAIARTPAPPAEPPREAPPYTAMDVDPNTLAATVGGGSPRPPANAIPTVPPTQVQRVMAMLNESPSRISRKDVPERPIPPGTLDKSDLIGVALGSLVSAGLAALTGSPSEAASRAVLAAVHGGASGITGITQGKEERATEARKESERVWKQTMESQDAQERSHVNRLLGQSTLASEIDKSAGERLKADELARAWNGETTRQAAGAGSLPHDVFARIDALPHQFRGEALTEFFKTSEKMRADSAKPKAQYGEPFKHPETGQWVQKNLSTGKLETAPVPPVAQHDYAYSFDAQGNVTGRKDLNQLPKDKEGNLVIPKGFTNPLAIRKEQTEKPTAAPAPKLEGWGNSSTGAVMDIDTKDEQARKNARDQGFKPVKEMGEIEKLNFHRKQIPGKGGPPGATTKAAPGQTGEVVPQKKKLSY